jgi:ABC-2 type transport system ATP-binding protein
MPAPDNGILVEGIAKAFGDVVALDGVDLAIDGGTVFGLLGPNGAGKTTMVRILATLLRPDQGRAVVAGYDVVADAARLRSVIGLAGQSAAVDENLTGRENLEMVGRLYRLGARESRRRAGELLEMFDLTDAADRTSKTYSGGMRRRLDLGASLVGQPLVLFMDEPTTGLDPRSRLGLWEFIEGLVDEGTTLLLTTQYLEEADRLADRIGVIDQGRLIAEGTSSELKSRIGGDVLELEVADKGDLGRAAEAIGPLGCEQPIIEEANGRVVLPVADAGVLTEAVRRLDGAAISIAQLAIRRPTLDDVFLTLTGHHAVESPAENGIGHRERRRTRSRA